MRILTANKSAAYNLVRLIYVQRPKRCRHPDMQLIIRLTVLLDWQMVLGSRIVTVIEKEAVIKLLRRLDIHKSMGPDGIHPRVMRKLVDEFAKMLSIIYQQSWLTGEVPDDWKLASVTPIYKQGWKKDPSNYRSVNLTSVPGKVTRLVDVGKAVDVVYLDFSKAFDTASHSIFLEKLAADSLKRNTLCWIKSWLNGQT
ncbi:hypothetical protein TURU_129812 [Turdus rufiventris]|nr:hypothetical protein TURU_129812 [Turdus rufiventris]